MQCYITFTTMPHDYLTQKLYLSYTLFSGNKAYLKMSGWVTFLSMDETWKLNKDATHHLKSREQCTDQEWITNKENGCVVSNKIPVSILSIEFYSKPTWITNSISTSRLTTYSKAHINFYINFYLTYPQLRIVQLMVFSSQCH